MQDTAEQKDIYDKRTSLTEAVGRYLKDGINIAMDGFTNNCIPVATIHEIIRQGAQNLKLSVQSNSICCELLAGAMILNPEHLSIRQIELSWGDNNSSGTALLLRHLINNMRVTFNEYTDCSMTARFNAGALGLPFQATIDHGSNDTKPTNCGKTIICPFTGKDVYVVPACHPDLALIHVQAADMYGNSLLFGDQSNCLELAQAAANTIVTAEQIIAKESIKSYENLARIPAHVIDAVVDQPFGATPGACYGNYGVDMAEFDEFRAISEEFCTTGNKEKLRSYYNKSIFDVENFDDFLEQKPYPILQKLCQMDSGQI